MPTQAAAKIARMFHRRPPAGRFRDQLFWLVDVIYACKSSGNHTLLDEARMVEEALGRLGEYLETGDTEAMEFAMAQLERFAGVVRALASLEPDTGEE